MRCTGRSPPTRSADEETPYRPNSPYSATKAGADHLVRAWHHTYGLPTLTTNCSNNYGPYQFPEKLIPLVILNALASQPLPVYGRGENVRDWLHVEDHVDALLRVLESGRHRRDVLNRWRRGASQHRRGAGGLPDARRARARLDRPARAADHVRHRPAGPRSPLRHRREQDSRGARRGGRRARSSAGCARRCAGTSTTGRGGSACAPGRTAARTARPASGWATAASGWGSAASSRRARRERTSSEDSFR